MTETVHQPKHSFAKSGPRVIGFARTQLDQGDEVASRKGQTERIRAYSAERGMVEPYVLPTAAFSELHRLTDKGCVVVTTRLANLLRRPSDVDSLLTWSVANNIRIHVIEMGGDITDRLGSIRQISDCYAPLETELEQARKNAQATETHHEAVLTEAVGRVVHAMTAKFMGLKSEVNDITNAAKQTVTDPVLRERRERAAQMIASQAERQRQIDSAEEWHAQGAAHI